MRKYLTLLCAAGLALASWAGPRNNILTLKQSITDHDIVFPESFETDTRAMMENWYLQNYTILDADVEKKDAGEVSEEEYIKRLKALPTIIEMPYNQVVRSYIDRYVKRNRTLVEEMLGMSLYYMPIFEQALEKEGLPLELKYLPVIESALNPNAVSRAGASGLWQFMVGTGKGLGLEVNSLVDERRDPYRSSEKAAAYLKDLYSIYNDWSLAIAAYNCGPANVNKALKRAGNENGDFWEIYNYLPRETRGYVPAFIAANYIMTYFKRHNISPGLARKPLITDTISINQRVHFNQIAHVLNMPIEEIRVLNPQYRQDVIPGNTRPYTLVLPSQQVYSYIMSEDSILAWHPEVYNHRDVVEPGGSTVSNDNDDSNYTYETKLVTEYHKVRRGETASSIAAHYGMSTNTFASLNGGSYVKRGQVVKVQTQKRVRVRKEEADGFDQDLTAQVEGDVEKYIHEDNDDESAQIDEVKQVEKAAVEARRHGPQTVHIESPKPTPKVEKPHQDTRQDSRQWHQRNERYADRRGHKGRSQEENYKHSRSSSKRGDSAKRGKQARVEQPKTTEHTIQKGESLTKIAEQNGTTVEALRKANNISGDKIKAGENIKIPGKASSKSSGKSSGKSSKASKGSKSSSKASGKSSSKSSGKSSGKKKKR